MATPNPKHIDQPAHWLEALLLPRLGWGNVDAVHTLLSTGTADIPDEYPASQRPLFESFIRGSSKSLMWEFLQWEGTNHRWPLQRKNNPLPLIPNHPFPDSPALPGPSGQPPKGAKPEDYLKTHEAVFARLLAAGANPWLEVQLPSGPVDGFDLACAWCCAPLVEACLRHPDRPSLDTLHRRNPWRLQEPPKLTDDDSNPLFSGSDTLVHAFAANGDIDSLRVILDHGWEAGPGTGERAPLELAASPEVVSALLEAGGIWDESYAATWRSMASFHHALTSTLVERLKVVEPEESPEVAQERMAVMAVRAFWSQDYERLGQALAFFNPDIEGSRDKYDPFDREKAKAWLSMPEVSMAGSGRGKKSHPLYHVARRGIRDSSNAGKKFLGAAYTFGALVRVSPLAEIEKGLTGRAMAHLFLARLMPHNRGKNSRERLEGLLDKHGNEGSRTALVREIMTGRMTMTKGSVAGASRELHQQTETYLRKHLAFSTEEERFQALTECLDLFQQEGLKNDATLPAKDWLEDQPLQVRVEWGVALAAGSQLRALGDQVDCIVAQLRGAPHEESLDNSLEKLEMALAAGKDRAREEALAVRIREARMEWSLPQVTSTARKSLRF